MYLWRNILPIYVLALVVSVLSLVSAANYENTTLSAIFLVTFYILVFLSPVVIFLRYRFAVQNKSVEMIQESAVKEVSAPQQDPGEAHVEHEESVRKVSLIGLVPLAGIFLGFYIFIKNKDFGGLIGILLIGISFIIFAIFSSILVFTPRGIQNSKSEEGGVNEQK